MTILDSIIQGIVQGLTEFLPVSSSGHLMISQHILGVNENNLFFSVMLHLGTLIAVVAVYYKTLIELVRAFFEILKKFFTGKFSLKDLTKSQNMVIMLILGLVPLFLMFVPVPGSGTNVKGVAQELAGDKNIFIVGIALIVTSVLLKMGINAQNRIRVRSKLTPQNEIWEGRTNFTILDALFVGITQFIAAVFPGVSRSGSTLSTGLIRGINKQAALDYSFILGIPAIVAAAVLETKEAVEVNAIHFNELPVVIVGMLVAAVVGFLSIKLFKWLLKTDKMMVFVIYTFVVGVIVSVIGIIEYINGVNIFTGAAL